MTNLLILLYYSEYNTPLIAFCARWQVDNCLGLLRMKCAVRDDMLPGSRSNPTCGDQPAELALYNA